MEFVVLEQIKTQRLLLRKLRKDDLECYYHRLGGNAEVTQYMLWQSHRNLQESSASIEKVLRKYQEGSCYCWAIALQGDDSMIGRIDLLHFDEQHSSCSFAYMIGKDFWNRGFGTEALKAVISFAFEKLQVRCITADHMKDNIASGKVMQNAGMRYVQTHIAKYEKHGKYHDADVYMITLEDWKQQNFRKN